MSLLKSETIKSMGAIIPCHKPPQNPNCWPVRHASTTSFLAHDEKMISSKSVDNKIDEFLRVNGVFMCLKIKCQLFNSFVDVNIASIYEK